LLPATPSNFSNQYSNPSPAAIWPERTSSVARFHAITALARAPPAEVPTVRMSRSASSFPAAWKCPCKSPRCVNTSPASRTSASTSIFDALRGLGPSTGANSSAPMPRVPV
jgi:hypothetical protein